MVDKRPWQGDGHHGFAFDGKMVKTHVNRWETHHMSRVRGSPERGGFEAVFHRFEAVIPPTLGVWCGERNQRRMHSPHGFDRLMGLLLNLGSGKNGMHGEHGELVPTLIFETGDGEQNRRG